MGELGVDSALLLALVVNWAGGGGLVAVGWWWTGVVGLVAALISLKSVGIVAMECHLGSRKMTGQQSTDVGW